MLISVPFTDWVTLPRWLRRPGCASAWQAHTRSRAIQVVARTGTLLLLSHVRILVIHRRRERLLDRAWTHPANEIELGTGLVVRARAACTTEGLLTDDRARWLVVHVE